MSPLASADRTSDSGMPFPRLTRSSYGLLASSFGSGMVVDIHTRKSSLYASMERSVDDVHLLVAGEAHEVDRITRHANRQARVLFRMIHRVHQRVAVQHVDVHVIASAAEEGIQDRREVSDAIL